jgi:polysaccharide deacetylase 2 family uncharacterized protein YibQ
VTPARGPISARTFFRGVIPNPFRGEGPLLSRSAASAFLFALVVAAAFLSGCHKQALSKTEVRAVTQEIVAAAESAAGHKLAIEIHPEEDTFQTSLSTTRHESDSIYLALENAHQADTLERSLAEIARRHKLKSDQSPAGSMVRVTFSRADVRTHTIHIILGLDPRPRPSAITAPGGKDAPMLAIIIDDMGHDRAPAEELLALPVPLTISVLPNQPFSAEVAEEAFRRGDQVLLHLPMEPMAGSTGSSDGVTQEPVELRVGMSADEVNSTLAGMLETVPHVVGVNNHEGSRATSDAALMQALMPALRQRNLFFIDSRTSATTVAYSTALRDGVPAAARKVFLDDTATKEAVLSQLDLAAKEAQRDGSAIAIGHPHPATIAALTQAAPSLESRGIRLVFASELLR